MKDAHNKTYGNAGGGRNRVELLQHLIEKTKGDLHEALRKYLSATALRQACKAGNLDSTGLKDELVQRLVNYVRSFFIT